VDNEASGWELIYRSTSTYDRAIPHEDAESLHHLFQENGVNRILDLGCGDGRHLHYFSNLGYEMFGLDYAPSALYLAGLWLTSDDLSAELVCADMTAIPWRDEQFDAVISFLVINHNPVKRIRQTIADIHRVLKPGGASRYPEYNYLFVRVTEYRECDREALRSVLPNFTGGEKENLASKRELPPVQAEKAGPR
jgi:SAM-dependent methyltransferase